MVIFFRRVVLNTFRVRINILKICEVNFVGLKIAPDVDEGLNNWNAHFVICEGYRKIGTAFFKLSC